MTEKLYTLTTFDRYCGLNFSTPAATAAEVNTLSTSATAGGDSLIISWKNLMGLNDDPTLGAALLKCAPARKFLCALWSNPSDWARETIEEYKVPVDMFYLPSNPAPWAINVLKKCNVEDRYYIVMAKNTEVEVGMFLYAYIKTLDTNSRTYQQIGYNLSRNPATWVRTILVDHPDMIDWSVFCHNHSDWARLFHERHPDMVRWDIITSSNAEWTFDFMMKHVSWIPRNPILKPENYRSVELSRLTLFLNGSKYVWPIERFVEAHPELGPIRYIDRKRDSPRPQYNNSLQSGSNSLNWRRK